jgi:RNA polymerase sigma-70 factor (ECF subfamily)
MPERVGIVREMFVEEEARGCCEREATPPPAHVDACAIDWGELLALVTPRVRVRFASDTAAFAERLLRLAGAAGCDTDDGHLSNVRRLSLDDLYLATACSLGDERAWEELADRHRGFMRAFARRFLREPDATDLADLWQRGKIARYEGRSTLRTWLGAVVAHAALNAGKARRRAAALGGAETPAVRPAAPLPAEPAASEAGSLLARLAAEAIGGLPADEKLLLYLYYEQGLTLAQMAVALRASKAALSRRLSRTRSRLRREIESLARRSAGASADALRAGIDLGRLEWSLSDLLGKHGSVAERALPQDRKPLGVEQQRRRAS